MSAAEGQENKFLTAMVKAAVQIVCKEKELDIPEDIDELAEFIVVKKSFDYGYRDICRKDHLPIIISDFLGEAVWSTKITENKDDDTAKVLVKIKDNVWQVDFKDFCKNRAADLSVKKLIGCKEKMLVESQPIKSEKNRIKNILQDFEDYKKEVENMKKNNNIMKAPTYISKNPQPQTTEQKEGRSFCDFLFGRWSDRPIVCTKTAHGYISHEQGTKWYEKFHACNNNPTLRPDYPHKPLAK